jgi:predicted DNA binding CopG/RHH family protein
MKLDKYEEDFLKSIDNQEWKSDENFNYRKKELESFANYTIRGKNKTAISLRISENDLFEIKKRGAENGIPYQSLIQLLIHQFVTNRIEIKI